MISKPVTVEVPALGRTASEAQVSAFADGVYTFDLLDAEGVIARSRYATPAEAPFTLTQAELDALLAPPEPVMELLP